MRLIIALLVISSLLLVGCQTPRTTPVTSEGVADKQISDIDAQIAKIEEELRNQAKAKDIKVEEPAEEEEEKQVEVKQPEEIKPKVEEKVVETTKTKTPPSNEVSKTLTVKEGELVELKVAVEDDEDVTVSFSSPLDSNGKWQTGYEDSGEYLITVTVDDGDLKTTQTVKLVVEEVNRAPKIVDITLG
jgi:preprotein translocase subunit SecF